MSQKPLDLALAFVEHGWPIFPCRSAASEAIDHATGEITVLAEKTPHTSNGFKAATKYRRIIERWWSDWPDAAVGIPTGAATGVFVLDIDNKPGGANGFAWLSDMEAEHGPLPVTARVTSPNGGLHIYFNYVAGTRNRGALGAGVDVRSEGGYVLAAGSTMSDGRSYKWAPVSDTVPEIADAPEWLLALLLPKPAPVGQVYTGGGAGNTAYVNRAVEQELAELAGIPMGAGRNNGLNDAAFSLGQWVGGGQIAESEARALLQDVARSWGRDWNRCCKTIENGLKAGMAQPRHPPEPDFQHDNTKLVDVTKMLANGLAKGKELKVSEHAAREDVEPASEDLTYQNGIEVANDNEPQQPDLPIIATPFNWVDPRTLARREFAFGTHYIRKYVSVTVSPGGLGKTSNSIVEALAMASGRALTGTKPPKRMKVWLFNAEDPRDELERRIMAACIHFNLKPEDINGYLYLDTGREQELVVAKEDKRNGVTIQAPIVEAVVAQLEANAIDVMIVDPFVSTHSVNENDNGAIDKVAKLWAQVADYTNSAIDIVHHLRKVADREATVEDARGAVSLIGAARSVRVLNRMSDEQAKAAGLPEVQRFGYFSINYGKSNLTPLSHRLDWRKLESVPLGNGVGMDKPQDFAPVVTEWRWPSAEDAVADISQEKIDHIKVTLDNGCFKQASNSKPWAGEAIGYVLGIDAEEKAGRKQCGDLLKAWIEDGVLTVIEERDPVTRHFGKFVRSAA